jgi:hypothetical protein
MLYNHLINQSNRKASFNEILLDINNEKLLLSLTEQIQNFSNLKNKIRLHHRLIKADIQNFEKYNYSSEIFEQIDKYNYILTNDINTFKIIVKYYCHSNFQIEALHTNATQICNIKLTNDNEYKFIDLKDIFLNQSINASPTQLDYILNYILLQNQEHIISSKNKKIYYLTEHFNRSIKQIEEILNNKLSVHSEAFHVLNKNNQKIMQLKFISNKNIKTSEFVNFVKSKIDLQKIKITSIKNHEDVEIYPLIINWNKEFNFFILTLENINESAFDEQTIEKLYFSLKDYLNFLGYEIIHKNN